MATRRPGGACKPAAWPRIFPGKLRPASTAGCTKRLEKRESETQLGHPNRVRRRGPIDMAENVSSVTDNSFQTEVIDASQAQPVMVDFWADWCRPCHMLAPTVAEIAQDYAGRLKVVKLNVDENMNAAGRFNIRGIPTLLIFKGGQVADQIVGAGPKEKISKVVDRHLN